MCVFSHHALNDRVNGTLNDLVNDWEVVSAINALDYLPQGEWLVHVKTLPKFVYLGRGPADPKGDCIVAKIIVNAGSVLVKTVMLRKSTSKSDNYEGKWL